MLDHISPNSATLPQCDRLPERVDVVVIGGGIIGTSAALFLAQRKLRVLLLEKGRIGAEQSARNWGWCRVSGRDEAEIPIGIESLRLWQGMNDLIEGETGFTRAGILYTCDTSSEVAAREKWAIEAKSYGVEARVLRGSELESILPGSRRPFAGGLYTAADGRAEPSLAAVAIAKGFHAMGGLIAQNCAARTVDVEAGRVTGVVTESGRVRCDAVLLAGGAWSRLFTGNLGLDFPQLTLMGSVFRTQPLDGLPNVAVGGSDFAFRKRLDGGYTVARRNGNYSELSIDHFRLFRDFVPAFIKNRKETRLRAGKAFFEDLRIARRWNGQDRTPFEMMRVLDPVPSDKMIEESKSLIARAFPGFAQAREVARWGGIIDATPDAVPVIAPISALPGFFLASGFSGHGFGIGPGAGHLAADIVSGSRPIVDPAPFRAERFSRLIKSYDRIKIN